MLVSGGLLDQPVKWFNVQYAGYIKRLVDGAKREGFKFSEFSDSERELYLKIVEIQNTMERR